MPGAPKILFWGLESYRLSTDSSISFKAGRTQKDDDILVDEYYAKESIFMSAIPLRLIDHDWHLSGIFESGKLTRIAMGLPVQDLTGNPASPQSESRSRSTIQAAPEVVNELRKRRRATPSGTGPEQEIPQQVHLDRVLLVVRGVGTI